MLRVYDAMYDLLFTQDLENRLKDVIKVGNRRTYGTKLGTKLDPKPPSELTADYPELILVDEGGEYNEHANSSQARYLMALSFYISTGSLQYWAFASAINWYIACNMKNWNTTLTAVTWCGNHIVTNLQTIPLQIGQTNPMKQADLVGFSLIWRAQIEMYIPHAHLVHTEVLP